jgi:rare lipoprotein A (peptidoglycan hydrolase)
VKLRKKTIGVAHKTLPCGTLLDFSFRGKSIAVPVIDRGPFVAGISYDFTIEVAKRLGFVNTGRGFVGVLRSGTKLTQLSAAQLPGAIPAAG